MHTSVSRLATEEAGPLHRCTCPVAPCMATPDPGACSSNKFWRNGGAVAGLSVVLAWPPCCMTATWPNTGRCSGTRGDPGTDMSFGADAVGCRPCEGPHMTIDTLCSICPWAVWTTGSMRGVDMPGPWPSAGCEAVCRACDACKDRGGATNSATVGLAAPFVPVAPASICGTLCCCCISEKEPAGPTGTPGDLNPSSGGATCTEDVARFSLEGC